MNKIQYVEMQTIPVRVTGGWVSFDVVAQDGGFLVSDKATCLVEDKGKAHLISTAMVSWNTTHAECTGLSSARREWIERMVDDARARLARLIEKGTLEPERVSEDEMAA